MVRTCCQNHLDETGRSFTPEAIELISTKVHSKQFSAAEYKELVKKMMERRTSVLTFDQTTTNDDFDTFLGLSKENFEDLYSIVSPFMKDLQSLDSRNCIALFLTKIRLSQSFKVIGKQFGVSKQRVCEIFEMVRKVLQQHFVPSNIGYNHISREQYIWDHGTILSQVLLEISPNTAVWVMDGTYLYIEKSKNYEVQRNTYSMHRLTPLNMNGSGKK